MEKLRQTPSQTVGPFFAYGLTARQYGYDYTSIIDGALAPEEGTGDRIHVTGHVFDGAGKVIPDAMIELWQADKEGIYRSVPIEKQNGEFRGYGRLGTGTQPGHRFRFSTVKPGAVKGQAPHINVILFMRGSLRHLYTRIYFSDEDNDRDPLFQSVEKARRLTLIARRGEGTHAHEYNFDIHMQGENETVFFDLSL